MTLLEIAPSIQAVAHCPFSVTDRDVGHWSILLDGRPSVSGPKLTPPTPTWAGSPTTIVETPGRTTFVFGELYGPERERLKSRLLENRRGTLFDASRINGHCAILSIERIAQWPAVRRLANQRPLRDSLDRRSPEWPLDWRADLHPLDQPVRQRARLCREGSRKDAAHQ